MPRKEKCPAWGSKCLNCECQNHFTEACQKAKVKHHFDGRLFLSTSGSISMSAGPLNITFLALYYFPATSVLSE